MTGKRINIPAILIVLAILAIVIFQGYWLHKNYVEEEKTLEIRATAIFRSTAYRLQAENLTNDTSFRFWSPVQTASPADSDRSVRVVNKAVSESPVSTGKQLYIKTITANTDSFVGRDMAGAKQIPHFGVTELSGTGVVGKDIPVTANPGSGVITLKSGEGDSLRQFVLLSRLMEDGNFQAVLRGPENLGDTVDLKELASRFRNALDKELMNIRFSLVKDSLSQYPASTSFHHTQSSEVLMGYSKPYYIRYQLLNSFQYITGRLSSLIILSLLLIGLTSFTFVLLYRNMMKQKRLTQIKNDLISNITHELKTPIATVSVAIEALRSFNAMDHPHRVEEYLDISNSELQRLSLLVDKALRLSMFEKQQVVLNMEKFDLKQLVEEVIGSMRLQFEKARAVVILRAEETGLNIEADRLHITSVVFNLLDNALKYSLDAPEITVTISRNTNSVRLEVSDNGYGIPSAYREKVFEKFFRVPSGDTHNVKGYGLGLSYVAYVVERHKGKIEVQSERGKGSSFIIHLPDTI